MNNRNFEYKHESMHHVLVNLQERMGQIDEELNPDKTVKKDQYKNIVI